jgi:hypothetical protein
MTVKGYESDLAEVDRGEFLPSRLFVMSDVNSANRWRIAKYPPAAPPKTGGCLPPDPRGYLKKGYEGHRIIIRRHNNTVNDFNGARPSWPDFWLQYWLGR